MNGIGHAGGEELVEDRTVLDELSREECLALVATVPIGRVAVGVVGQSPLVWPVNFALDVDVVVFRTDEGDKRRGLENGPATFQVDAFDPYHRTGWSVLIHGVAEDASDEQIGHVVVRPWAPGAKATWVQIRPTLVTGRRLRIADAAGDDRGYL